MFEQVEHPELLDPAWQPHSDRLYCLDCIFPDKGGYGYAGSYGAKQHCEEQHGVRREDFDIGVHVVLGSDLKRLLAVWRRDNEDSARVFARDLARILDVDDFLYEVEDRSR